MICHLSTRPTFTQQTSPNQTRKDKRRIRSHFTPFQGQASALAHTDEELEQRGVELWKEGYYNSIRNNCRKQASRFDKKSYFEKWLKVFRCIDVDSRTSLEVDACKNISNLPSQLI
jgi:hypothetical protein